MTPSRTRRFVAGFLFGAAVAGAAAAAARLHRGGEREDAAAPSGDDGLERLRSEAGRAAEDCRRLEAEFAALPTPAQIGRARRSAMAKEAAARGTLLIDRIKQLKGKFEGADIELQVAVNAAMSMSMSGTPEEETAEADMALAIGYHALVTAPLYSSGRPSALDWLRQAFANLDRVLSLLEALEPAPDDAQESRFEELLARTRTEGAFEPAAGEGTSIERLLADLVRHDRWLTEIEAALTDRQVRFLSRADILGDFAFRLSGCRSGNDREGCIDDVIRNLLGETRAYAGGFQARKEIEVPLRAAAGEWLDADTEYEADMHRRAAAGEKIRWRSCVLARLRLRTAFQKKVLDSVALDASERKAVERWMDFTEYDIRR